VNEPPRVDGRPRDLVEPDRTVSHRLSQSTSLGSRAHRSSDPSDIVSVGRREKAPPRQQATLNLGEAFLDAADYDLLARFRARPATEDVVAAFRAALRAGYDILTDEQRVLEKRRNELILAVPEIRAAHLDHFAAGALEFTAAVAERADPAATIDQALAQLQQGFRTL
jgi:hypothetical protein